MPTAGSASGAVTRFQIFRFDSDVAIGDHEDVVPRATGQIDEVADLEIAAVHSVVDHELDIEMWIGRLQSSNNGDCRDHSATTHQTEAESTDASAHKTSRDFQTVEALHRITA